MRERVVWEGGGEGGLCGGKVAREDGVGGILQVYIH